MTHRTPLWLTVAALFGALAVVGSDVAEAKKRRPRGRKPHRFLSAPAPERGRTPDIASNGAPAAASRDVAGAAFDGEGRKDVLGGGAAIVLSATRALVANPYRGLAVVDVSDADAPRVLGSVTLEGTADRVFVNGTTALVVSRSWRGSGGRTTVATVDLSDEAHPRVVGMTFVEGDLVEASASGADLVVVTSDYGWDIYPMPYPVMSGGGALDGPTAGGPTADGSVGSGVRSGTDAMPGKVASGAPTGDASNDIAGPGFWFPWGAGDAKARVARITVDGAGRPQVAGSSEVAGTLLGTSIEGDDVVLAVDRTVWWTYDVAVKGDAPAFLPDGIALVDVDASSTTRLDGLLALDTITGVSSVDLEGDVVRIVGWGQDGVPRLGTYRLGSADPAALGSVDLPTWPGASVFSGDRFAFTWTTGFDPGTGVEGGVDDTKPGALREPPPADGPWAWVQAVDLSDPTAPAIGTSARLGDGWAQSLHAADGDVVATLTDWTATPATEVVRVGLADVSAPSVGATESIEGSWYATHQLGDLLLLSGGTYTNAGGYLSQVIPVSTAGGGLTAGAPISAASWVAAAAWEAPILALASIDSLRLVDLTDLSAPDVRGTVRLAANVSDLAVLGDDAAACLVTDYVGGTIEVRTVALPGADALTPLDVVEVGTGDARLFRDGSMLYVLATDWQTGGGRLTVVDASDASDLRVRGSLDLASYPGQAFLVNDSLVLLREAWSLVETDDDSGKTTSKSDPFGRARSSWTRDELASVIDVIDLSNPDEPTASVRRRIRWDTGGEAILRGSTLYVPSYTWTGTSEEGYDEIAYGVYAVDLDDPSRPRVSRMVAVPGSLVGAVDAAGRVLTVSYAYDQDTYAYDATLNVVDLTQANWRERVVASREIDGTAGAVVVGADHVYVAAETWNDMVSGATFRLQTLGLADLAVTSSISRERAAWGGTISSGHLFLRSWGWTGALDAFDLADPASPVAGASVSVDGVGTSVGVAGGRAYVPAGYRGVVGFDL